MGVDLNAYKEVATEKGADTIGFYSQLKEIKAEEEKALDAGQDKVEAAGAAITAEIKAIDTKIETTSTPIRNQIAEAEEKADEARSRYYAADEATEDTLKQEYDEASKKVSELYKELDKATAEDKAKKAELEKSLANAKKSVKDEIRKPFVEKQFEVLARMQELASKAYSADFANPKNKFVLELPELNAKTLYTKDIMEEDPWGYGPATKVGEQPNTEGNFRIRPTDGKGNGLDSTPDLFKVSLNNSDFLKDGGRSYLEKWFDTNKEAIIDSYKTTADRLIQEITKGTAHTADGNGVYTFDEKEIATLKQQFIEKNLLTDKTIGVSGSANYPVLLSNFFSKVNSVLERTDGYSKLPREALGNATGKVIPTEGVIIQRDVIPAVQRAGFIQYRQELSNRLGVTAWYLRSTGHENHTVHYTSEKGNESRSFGRLANVFGIGLQYQLGNRTAVSFDYGQNRTDFGRYMNGGSIYESTAGKVYENPAGNPQFELKGHRHGGTPHFWTLRFDVGRSDYYRSGSWNAFIDYKYFAHGAFLGGNGTGAVPDRYLDGIRSFTLGGGYVPAKDFMVEAFYTFDAKGIGQRDTLYGGENFKLGNYTRIQGTYKF